MTDMINSGNVVLLLGQSERTALQLAAANGHSDTMTLLIEAGADKEAADKVNLRHKWQFFSSQAHSLVKGGLMLIKSHYQYVEWYIPIG